MAVIFHSEMFGFESAVEIQETELTETGGGSGAQGFRENESTLLSGSVISDTVLKKINIKCISHGLKTKLPVQQWLS